MTIRRTNTEPLKSALQRYLHSIGATQKLKEIKLKKSWNELMSTHIVKDTDYINVEKNILFVKLKNPFAKNEVLMRKTSILKRLNDNAGEIIITDIKVL